MYGDGSANQGQLFESANMAGLWKLPVVYVIENNHFGMGTSVERASYYKELNAKFRGYPGLKVDATCVFAVREAVKFSKEYAVKHGPIFLEIDTYRYQGHSMSDPGSTYRTPDDVKNYRSHKDCINRVRNMIVSNNLATEDELKAIERTIKDNIMEDIEKIKKDPYPESSELLTNVYVEDSPYVRGVEYSDSYFNEHKV